MVQLPKALHQGENLLVLQLSLGDFEGYLKSHPISARLLGLQTARLHNQYWLRVASGMPAHPAHQDCLSILSSGIALLAKVRVLTLL